MFIEAWIEVLKLNKGSWLWITLFQTKAFSFLFLDQDRDQIRVMDEATEECRFIINHIDLARWVFGQHGMTDLNKFGQDITFLLMQAFVDQQNPTPEIRRQRIELLKKLSIYNKIVRLEWMKIK